MKQLKRTLALLLALALCLSLLGVTALASEEPVSVEAGETAGVEETAEAEGTIEAETPVESGEASATEEVTAEEITEAEGTIEAETPVESGEAAATEGTTAEETTAEESADDATTELGAECTCTALCEAVNPDCPVCATEEGWLYECNPVADEDSSEASDEAGDETTGEAGIMTVGDEEDDELASDDDFNDLKSTIESEENVINSEDAADKYTAESLAEMKEVIAAAKALLTDETATYQDVQDAEIALWNTLERIPESTATESDLEELESIAEYYEDLINSPDAAELYTAESIAEMKEVIATAKDLLTAKEPTYQDVWDAEIALWNTLERNPESAADEDDLTELEQEIETYEAYLTQTDKYTAESLAELETALAAAKALLTDETATYQDVQDAEIALWNTLERIPESAADEDDLTILKAAIETYEEYLTQTDKYTAESLAELETALAAAKTLLTDETATYQQIVDARLAIWTAPVRIPESAADEDDFLILEDFYIPMVEQALQTEGLYTEDSIKAMQEALAAAKALLTDETATYQDVVDAEQALLDSMVRIPDSAATEDELSYLREYVEYAQTLLEGGTLSAQEAAALKAAVEAAQKVLAQESITYADYEKVNTALEELLYGTEDDDSDSDTPEPDDTAEPDTTKRPGAGGSGGGSGSGGPGGGAPKTGDETNIALYVVLALVSVTGLAILAMRKRKEDK